MIASNFSGTATATPSNISQYYQFLSGETGVRGLVDTGPIGHEFSVVGTMYGLATGIATVNGTPYTTNIYTPTSSRRRRSPPQPPTRQPR